MEEVIGSIPIRSTKHPSFLDIPEVQARATGSHAGAPPSFLPFLLEAQALLGTLWGYAGV
jgi:hypothetical protein